MFILNFSLLNLKNKKGKRNYRFFYLFLVSLSILCLYILACNITNIVLRSQEQILVEAIKATPATYPFLFVVKS